MTDDIVLDIEPVEKIEKGGIIVCSRQLWIRTSVPAAENA